MQCWIPADFGSMGSRSPCCATACRVTDVRGVDAGGSDDHPAPRSSWAFLTNHAHVLLCIVRDPRVRLRDVATMVGITERAAQSIVADLVGEGYLSRQRVGRRNVYEVHRHTPLRAGDNESLSVGGLLDFLTSQRHLVDFAHAGLVPAVAGNGHGSNGNGANGANGNGNGHRSN